MNNVVFAQIANFETTNDRAHDSCVAFTATEFILWVDSISVYALFDIELHSS